MELILLTPPLVQMAYIYLVSEDARSFTNRYYVFFHSIRPSVIARSVATRQSSYDNKCISCCMRFINERHEKIE